jgi:hypothetical protein
VTSLGNIGDGIPACTTGAFVSNLKTEKRKKVETGEIEIKIQCINGYLDKFTSFGQALKPEAKEVGP